MANFEIIKTLCLVGRMFGPGDEDEFLEALKDKGRDAEQAINNLIERGAAGPLEGRKAPKIDEGAVMGRLMKKTKAELRALLPKGAEIVGSGSDGSVLKEDIAKAVISSGGGK